jgi:hypothetical protein
MAKRLRNLISFTPASNTVVIDGYVDRKTLLLITNTSYQNTVIYNFADAQKRATSVSYNSSTNRTTIALSTDCSAMSSSDTLQIFVEETTVLFEPSEVLTDPVNKIRMSEPQALIDTDFEYGTQGSKWESVFLCNQRPFAFFSPVNLVGTSATTGTQAGGVVISGITTLTMPVGTRRVTIASTTALPPNGTPVVITDANIANVNGNWIIEEGGGTGIATFTTKLRNDTGIVTCLSFAKTGIFSGSTYTGARIGISTPLSMPLGGFSTSTWAATINPGLAVTVTTSVPHGLVIGNEIGITSIFTGQNTALAFGAQGGVIGQGSPNGSYQVATVGSSTQFTYYVNTAPVGLATTAFNFAAVYPRPSGQVLHRAFDGGVVFGTYAQSNYEQAVRQSRRYFRYQSGKGIQMSSGTTLKPNVPIETITSSGTIVTVRTKEVHGISRVVPGTQITVSGCTETAYNGTFDITSVSGTNVFTYNALSTPSATTATGNYAVNVTSWTGAISRLGLFDFQNGMFFEFDGANLYLVRRQSIFQIAGRVTVTQESTQIVQSNPNYPTLFSKQLTPGGNIVIRGQTYKVTDILSDTEIRINPAYRGTSDQYVTVTRTDDLRIPQSSWNLDRMDGTGPSGYNIDLSKMQMFYMDYSWYGAGFVRWGFRGTGGNVMYAHKMVNNNLNQEAYMRSGNLPARYETLTHPPTTTLTTTLVSNDNYIGIASTAGFPVPSGTVLVRQPGNFPGTGDLYEYINYAGVGTTSLTGLTRGRAGYPFGLTLTMGVGANTGIGSTANLQVGQRVVSGVGSTSFASNTFITAVGINSVTFSTAALDNNPSVIIPPMATTAGVAGAQTFTYSATKSTVVELAYPTFAPTISHWGTSVIMDGRYDDDKSLVFTYGQSNPVLIPANSERGLFTIRIAPSVDNGIPGPFGSRELVNRMQLVMRQLGMSVAGVTTAILVRGYLNSTPQFPTVWTNAVGNISGRINSSLAQIADHSSQAGYGVTMLNGEVVCGFYVGTGAGTLDLSQVRDLGNSIVGGGGTFANSNIYPDGPDTFTITATNLSTQQIAVAARLSWTEAQA